jgi:hypothetical protein
MQKSQFVARLSWFRFSMPTVGIRDHYKKIFVALPIYKPLAVPESGNGFLHQPWLIKRRAFPMPLYL